jgi:hypothetical protein
MHSSEKIRVAAQTLFFANPSDPGSGMQIDKIKRTGTGSPGLSLSFLKTPLFLSSFPYLESPFLF